MENSWNFTTTDGIKLFAQSWEVESPKAVIVLVHGHGEYCNRYANLANYFNQNQVSVFGFDLRGHGRSDGKRGHSPSYQALMDDIAQFIGIVKNKVSGVPYVLYGHSMGGNLVLNYGLQSSKMINAVVASSPLIKLAFEPPQSKLMLAKLMGGIYPALTVSSELDSAALSHDVNVVQQYVNDPLVHDKISVGLYNGLYSKGLYALENATKFPLPLFLFHGTEDKLTSFDASQEFASTAGKNVVFKKWEGLYHETHNEPEKQQVYEEVMKWINTTIL